MKKIMTLYFFGILLTGCGPIELPEMHEYALVLPIQSVEKKAKTDKTILVSTSMADPGYDSTAIVYTQEPYELQRYAQSRWMAPPSKMLRSMVINALRNGHYFKAVVTPSVASHADYQLNIHLDSLQQSFLKKISRVHLGVTVTLIDVATLKVLATHTYVYELDSPGNNAYSGVVAANQAAQWVVNEIVKFARFET